MVESLEARSAYNATQAPATQAGIFLIPSPFLPTPELLLSTSNKRPLYCIVSIGDRKDKPFLISCPRPSHAASFSSFVRPLPFLP